MRVQLYILTNLDGSMFQEFTGQACLRINRIATEKELKELLFSYIVVYAYKVDPKILSYLKSLFPDILDARKDGKITEFQYWDTTTRDILLVSPIKKKFVTNYTFDDLVFVLIHTLGDSDC